ncbi:peptidylprolyl isomerase [Sphingomonas sp. Leaf343]|uniref:peptidylprolyl isomerase n=1 Tax=Sphingomonas sp. Leaf343 TaxID=1736345 RepID=UPI0006F5B523|nr:peptidylprolyl isomerase [Sphingomonas sp. Leaf343]KQR80510.1 peptidylprolyl isomerase [Sphingomonas sp. Leaf343]
MLSFLLALLQTAVPASSDALPADWRAIPDDEVVVMTLADGGRVVIRLAAGRAAGHVANIRKLAVKKWWDAGGSVYRVQDNYVAQWGDVTEKKPLPADVEANPPAEYEWQGEAPVAKLTRRDPYAEWAGYTRDGWPLAGSGASQWLPHCYGMVGVARDLAPSTGSGGDLYAVIGHGPRALDRNIAVVGRVVEGIERLSALPRGTGDLGFYKAPAETPMAIRSVRLASQMPAAERPRFQYRATDNPRFAAWIKTRENRQPPFFVVPAGGADICNAMPPVRRAPPVTADAAR